MCIVYQKYKNIEIIENSENAPKVPQARGIENFWASCKKKNSKKKTFLKHFMDFAEYEKE